MTIDLFITTLALNRTLYQNCLSLKNALKSKNIPFQEHDVAKNRDALNVMMEVSGNKKLPQLHVNGANLGSYDMLVDWIEEDCLAQALVEAGWDKESSTAETAKGASAGAKDKAQKQQPLPKKIHFPPNLDPNQDESKINEDAPSLEELREQAKKRREALESEIESDTDDELGSPVVSDLEDDNPWRIER